jgi:hypothetical protein
MKRGRALLLLPVLAVTLSACGGGDGDDDAAPIPRTATLTTAAAAKLPELARTALEPGEVLFTGKASRTTHGSFPLDGSYVVRFEQFAPEDPEKDFSKETAFTARLRPSSSSSEGVKLFGAAAASGETEITRHGRYSLDVMFGDFPYAVRFTPRG